MRLIWVTLGTLVGVAGGAILGFGAALAAMSISTSRTDGTFGMREVLVCVPSGAIIGGIAGIWWGLTTALAP